MFRILLLILIGVLGAPTALLADFKYLHLEIIAPPNGQIVEGVLMGDYQLQPPGITLYGSLDLGTYHTFDGMETTLPAGFSGDVLLASAKDGSYATHATMHLFEGTTAASGVALLVNSRERITYDLLTDTYWYGTKVINFSRDKGFQITFLYGGVFNFFDPEHFEVRSAGGVITDITILTAPEPSACMLITAAASMLLLRRWRGSLHR